MCIGCHNFKSHLTFKQCPLLRANWLIFWIFKYMLALPNKSFLMKSGQLTFEVGALLIFKNNNESLCRGLRQALKFSRIWSKCLSISCQFPGNRVANFYWAFSQRNSSETGLTHLKLIFNQILFLKCLRRPTLVAYLTFLKENR